MRLARILALLPLLALAAPAHALLFRAYVSSTGNDLNPCTLVAPCRLLPAALDAVEPGGEVWMLDSGNYNTTTVTVPKSVTILAVPGALGSLTAPSGPALQVIAPNLKVTLRNLVVRPFGPVVPEQAGILLQAHTSYLVIQNCNVSGFKHIAGAFGIRIDGQSTMDVTDTVVQDVETGIQAEGGAFVTVSNSRIYGASNAGIAAHVLAGGITTSVTVSDSVVARSGHATRIYASAAAAGGAARMHVTRSTLSHNGTAAFVQQVAGEATGTLSGSVVQGNGNAYLMLGGVLETAGNNVIRANGPPTGTLTPVATN